MRGALAATPGRTNGTCASQARGRALRKQSGRADAPWGADFPSTACGTAAGVPAFRVNMTNWRGPCSPLVGECGREVYAKMSKDVVTRVHSAVVRVSWRETPYGTPLMNMLRSISNRIRNIQRNNLSHRTTSRMDRIRIPVTQHGVDADRTLPV